MNFANLGKGRVLLFSDSDELGDDLCLVLSLLVAHIALQKLFYNLMIIPCRLRKGCDLIREALLQRCRL